MRVSGRWNNGLLVIGISILMTAVACSRGGDKPDSTPIPTTVPTRTVSTRVPPTVPAGGITPTATARPAAIGSPPTNAEFAFSGEIVRIDFDSDWRVSSQGVDLITYTHKDFPGEVLFTVQWVTDAPSDIAALFNTRLELLADAVVEIEGAPMAGVNASRHVSTFVDSRGEVTALALNSVATVRGSAIMATFVAPPDEFELLAAAVEHLIGKISVN